MQYIYLDWNVIQYMKNGFIDNKKSINGEELEELIKGLSKRKYKFPFSEGHLRDLSVGYKEENLKYIKEDLKYLNSISDGCVLALDNNENLIITTTDINIFFNSIIDEKEKETSIECLNTNSFEIDMDTLQKDTLLEPFLNENHGVLDNNVMNNFISMMHENIDNPQFYKELRLEVSNLKKQFKNTENTVINQSSNYFKELIPFLDFLDTDDLSILRKNFHKTMVSFLNIDKKRNFDNMTMGSKIELAYAILDYNPNFRDKINSKNKPSNMYRDIKNLYFASQAKYYITEDNMTYKKAKFVCDTLDLNVKVMKMNEFISKFR